MLGDVPKRMTMLAVLSTASHRDRGREGGLRLVCFRGQLPHTPENGALIFYLVLIPVRWTYTTVSLTPAFH